MIIKYNMLSGTYYVYKPCKPVELRKSPTKKMKEIMKNEPKIDRNFKVWKDN